MSREKLTMARSVLDAAKARLQDALKREEVARNEIAVLDAQRPNSFDREDHGQSGEISSML